MTVHVPAAIPLDRQGDCGPRNTRPRFSTPDRGLNRRTRRARAKGCKRGFTTTRGTCGKSGLDCLNNRHYDPTTGVFVSVDPLVTMTMEPYIYGAANPITNSDPTGLEPRPIHNRNAKPSDLGDDPYHSDCGGYGCPGSRKKILHGQSGAIADAANAAGVSPALLAAIYRHERISFNGGTKDHITDILKIQGMDLRRALTGDESPSIGFTQIDLATFLRTVQNHPDAFPELDISVIEGVDLDTKASNAQLAISQWVFAQMDYEPLSIRVAAFRLADLQSEFAGVDLGGVSMDRVVAAGYNISTDTLLSQFPNPSTSNPYVYSSYATNRLDSASWLGAFFN